MTTKVRDMQGYIRGAEIFDVSGSLNEFDRRANEVKSAYPRFENEVDATAALVGDNPQMIVIGHQLLDITLEHVSQQRT